MYEGGLSKGQAFTSLLDSAAGVGREVGRFFPDPSPKSVESSEAFVDKRKPLGAVDMFKNVPPIYTSDCEGDLGNGEDGFGPGLLTSFVGFGNLGGNKLGAERASEACTQCVGSDCPLFETALHRAE